MWLKIRTISRSLVCRMPFVTTIESYDSETRIEAFWKFIVLWSLSVLPLIFAAIEPIASGRENKTGTLNALNAEFSSTSVLVYSVSYLVPFLYVGVELAKRQNYFSFSRKEAPKNLNYPDGYKLLVYISVVVFLFTTFTYKRGSELGTGAAFMSGGVKWMVYIYSVACWYITLLIESGASTVDGSRYRDSLRQSESAATKALSDRLNAEGQE
jgi:hypothetical protein